MKSYPYHTLHIQIKRQSLSAGLPLVPEKNVKVNNSRVHRKQNEWTQKNEEYSKVVRGGKHREG